MFYNKRIKKIEKDIKDLKEVLSFELNEIGMPFGSGKLSITKSRRFDEHKKIIQLILKHLDLHVQTECTEDLPKLVKRENKKHT